MPALFPPIRPQEDNAPPVLPPISQQAPPDLGQPTPAAPSSILGNAVSPGQPIAPEQMHEAKMKNIGEQAAKNRDALSNLDWQDPNYTQKLTKLHMQHGELERQHAEEKMANPWGTPGNHPGILGKIGHGLATVGNVAGAALAPSLTAAIPGSKLNLQAQEAQGKAEEEAAGKEGQQAATTAATEAEVPLKEAQTKEAIANAETKGEEKPITEPSAATLHDLMTGQNGQPRINPDTNKPYTYLEALEATKQAGANPQADKTPPHITAVGPDGKSHIMERDPATGQYSIDRGIAPPSYAQAAPEIKGTFPLMIPDGKGGYTVQLATPGTHVAPGAITPQGAGQLNMGTQLTRNSAAQAQQAHEKTPEVLAEIDALRGKLGPISGRWNEFMQGRVGANDPELAELRADLLFLSSRIALMHAYGRLPENLRVQFDNELNRPDQSPDNLIKTLQTADTWAVNQIKLGQNPNPQLFGTAPPAAGTTPAAAPAGEAGTVPSVKDWLANRGK